MKHGPSVIIAACMLLVLGGAPEAAHCAGEVATVRLEVNARTVRRGSPEYSTLLAFLGKHAGLPGVRAPDPQDLGDFTVGYVQSSTLHGTAAGDVQGGAAPLPPYSPAATDRYRGGDSFHAETCLDGHLQRWEFRFEAATGWSLQAYRFQRLTGDTCTTADPATAGASR